MAKRSGLCFVLYFEVLSKASRQAQGHDLLTLELNWLLFYVNQWRSKPNLQGTWIKKLHIFNMIFNPESGHIRLCSTRTPPACSTWILVLKVSTIFHEPVKYHLAAIWWLSSGSSCDTKGIILIFLLLSSTGGGGYNCLDLNCPIHVK